ncbi:MAG: phosphoribosylamine--glycine ligase [Armatimonadota bacterium]|nr:phosphoribosylamine--glycine ligase [Armatimonadota bacterium]MCX7776852.1 phosphoribosylamine--glycine ligase [Armatimonadota bacterium]MDW8024462.1 phosphoribosylamine--glycine ligase [Armatimonadota bacterium]
MKVLVVGSGGREHALVWKLKQSPHVKEVHCASGNAGIAKLAKCVDIDAEDIPSLVSYAEAEKIDLTIVGPEAPLAAGIVDEFERRGLRIFGPNKLAAEIESSKAFCKQLLRKYGIPTAQFEIFDDASEALKYVRSHGAPVVVKASGLAAGKGSIVCRSVEEAVDAVERIMIRREFGSSGDLIVVEEYLDGEEASVMVFTDGEAVKPMLPSQDHKPVFDDDTGPNTGGMGAYCPVPAIDEALFERIIETIIKPTVAAMAGEGRPYKGVLYAGLMLTVEGPKVLEYNCRFGDPETQAVLPLMDSDLVEIINAVIDGRLNEAEVCSSRRCCVCVVMASGGYPGKYEKGKVITGVEDAEALDDVIVFHAGTAVKEGQLVTNGGRVLGVTALGDDFLSATKRAYDAVSRIWFDGMHYRRDIGRRALRRLGLA